MFVECDIIVYLSILPNQTTGALIIISEYCVILRLFFLSLVISSISACSFFQPYKFNIPQGNEFNDEKFEQVKAGMTPAQVIYLLGTPAIQDPFAKDRWDYVYYLTDEKREISKRLVTLTFKDNKLASIEEKYNTIKKVEKQDTEEADKPED